MIREGWRLGVFRYRTEVLMVVVSNAEARSASMYVVPAFCGTVQPECEGDPVRATRCHGVRLALVKRQK